MGKRHRTRHAGLCDTPWTTTVTRTVAPLHARAVIVLLITFGTSACASRSSSLQGQWIGVVNPVSGICDPSSQAVLTIESGEKPPYSATFAPTSGVLTLHGSSDGVSRVEADLHATGANHQPYILAFSGSKAKNLIVGTYTTQRCRSTIELRRE